MSSSKPNAERSSKSQKQSVVNQAITGMKDILPPESGQWQRLEEVFRSLFNRAGYQEIRLPLLEPTELFARSIGGDTDIVGKEMYNFCDKSGENIALRPEGTASCVRAAIQHQLLYNRGQLTQKLWYLGPMFRHEKPQKGRQRQFHQFGVELFGFTGPVIEAELISLSFQLFKTLGLNEHLELQINTLGASENRKEYRAALCRYLEPLSDQLDSDSQRRLGTNPLRILDSKNATTQSLLANAPKLHDFLDDASRSHWENLLSILDRLEIPYKVNQRLVRGLDYYNDTVFEWTTDKLGAQGTLAAGGRYDGLVEQLGGRACPAFGFAAGLERILLLMDQLGRAPLNSSQPSLYLIGSRVDPSEVLLYADRIRHELPQLTLETHLGEGGLKSQLKKADRSSATHVLILGDAELADQAISIKPLRGQGDQVTIAQTQLSPYLKETALVL